MNSPPALTGCLVDDETLDLDSFAAACGAGPDFVLQLVDEGLLLPAAIAPAWRFGGEALSRARRIRRLQAAFDAELACVAVMLDLIDELERLRAVVRRAGITDEAPGIAPPPAGEGP